MIAWSSCEWGWLLGEGDGGRAGEGKEVGDPEGLFHCRGRNRPVHGCQMAFLFRCRFFVVVELSGVER